MPQKATWLNEYEFTVYEPGTKWYEVPGIYIFAKPTSPGRWSALYVGQADNFRERLSSHEKWSEAQDEGATHIHALRVDRQDKRDDLEKLLIQKCKPVLNKQHRQ